MDKKTIGIIYGGNSTEHNVSINSARNICTQLNEKYNLKYIYIAQDGNWFIEDEIGKAQNKNKENDFESFFKAVDVVFPLLFGKFGEDGSIYGLLKMINKPYIGETILSAALALDKDFTKKMLRLVNIDVAKDLVLYNENTIDFDIVKEKLGVPFYVKSISQGTSIGVSKVYNEKDYSTALQYAFSYDTKVLLEENITCREFECCVMGSDDIICSEITEVVVDNDYYSYNAKVNNPDCINYIIPAPIPKEIEENIKEIAKSSYKALECTCMAKIDIFLKEDGTIVINEINTMPGFTNNSPFPRMWEKSGLSFSQIIDFLYSNALSVHFRQNNFLYKNEVD